jgi:cellulose synthase/poly-beta-1,6-N-acetylglucosamine synthase-like glycosyltransferase
VSALPLVSVLLPIRDAEGTLDACLASLVDQTLTDWECLAIDDGSSDGCRGIVAKWAGRDPRIIAAESPDPRGIVAALEKGRSLARGSFLARQDADDLSFPSRFAQQLQAMALEDSLGAVGCITRTPGELSDGMRRYLEWLAGCTDPETCAREIWIESPIAHPSVMMRAAALEAVGGYRGCGWPEDYDLWFRLLRAGWRIANVSQALYEWTDSPGRLSRRDPRYAPEAFLRCRVHHLRRWFAERGMTRPIVIWGAGRDGRRFARAWQVERSTGDAGTPAPEIVAFVDIDPRKIGRRRHGRPILDPESARGLLPDAFYVAAVGVPGARELIRSTLTSWGMTEGKAFLCVH